MNFKIIPTSVFSRQAKRLSKKYPSLKNDLKELGQNLLLMPRQGIPLGNSCFKIRMAISSKGEGKSGGARVITHIHLSAENIYLLSIYDKSDRQTISDSELSELLKAIK